MFSFLFYMYLHNQIISEYIIYKKMENTKYFGIIVPGETPFFDFDLVNDMLVVTVPNPGRWNNLNLPLANITTLTFFLANPLPDGLGGIQ